MREEILSLRLRAVELRARVVIKAEALPILVDLCKIDVQFRVLIAPALGRFHDNEIGLCDIQGAGADLRGIVMRDINSV